MDGWMDGWLDLLVGTTLPFTLHYINLQRHRPNMEGPV